eukprot:scaffold1598_cov259-Chaetoceros_neogracile.AAC.9
MAGFDFVLTGTSYDIMCVGSEPTFENDEDKEAFEQWRKLVQQMSMCDMDDEEVEQLRIFDECRVDANDEEDDDPYTSDWSKEHYLDDRYPWDSDKECRVDADDEEDDDPFIDWYLYDKCRYSCYRHFYVTSGLHECSLCDVSSCEECAEGSFKKCLTKDCDNWICGHHGNTKKCGECRPSNREEP